LLAYARATEKRRRVCAGHWRSVAGLLAYARRNGKAPAGMRRALA